MTHWLITISVSAYNLPYIVCNCSLESAIASALDQAKTEYREYEDFTVISTRPYEFNTNPPSPIGPDLSEADLDGHADRQGLVQELLNG